LPRCASPGARLRPWRRPRPHPRRPPLDLVRRGHRAGGQAAPRTQERARHAKRTCPGTPSSARIRGPVAAALLPCPVEVGLAPLLRCLRRERSRPGERLLPRPKASPSNSFCARSCRLAHRSGARAFRVVLLRGVIPEERHQAVLESRQHCPTRPITSFDISSR
jgi:hypothetical protein